MQVASSRQDEFVFNGFLACYWFGISFWEKAITKKTMAILMKETKIKTLSRSLTLEPGNKILAHSIIILLSEKTRTQNKRWAVFFITTSTLMTAVTNTRSFQCAGKLNIPINDFHSRKCLFNSFTWLFFG